MFQEINSSIVGAKITKVRYMTDHEMWANGWDSDGSDSPKIKPMVIELDNGAFIYAARDEDGTESGFLYKS